MYRLLSLKNIFDSLGLIHNIAGQIRWLSTILPSLPNWWWVETWGHFQADAGQESLPCVFCTVNSGQEEGHLCSQLCIGRSWIRKGKGYLNHTAEDSGFINTDAEPSGSSGGDTICSGQGCRRNILGKNLAGTSGQNYWEKNFYRSLQWFNWLSCLRFLSNADIRELWRRNDLFLCLQYTTILSTIVTSGSDKFPICICLASINWNCGVCPFPDWGPFHCWHSIPFHPWECRHHLGNALHGERDISQFCWINKRKGLISAVADKLLTFDDISL